MLRQNKWEMIRLIRSSAYREPLVLEIAAIHPEQGKLFDRQDGERGDGEPRTR